MAVFHRFAALFYGAGTARGVNLSIIFRGLINQSINCSYSFHPIRLRLGAANIVLTLYLLIDSSSWLDTLNLGKSISIVHIEGSLVIISK